MIAMRTAFAVISAVCVAVMLLCAVFAGAKAPAPAQQPDAERETRFEAVDIFIDPVAGRELAAYQFELVVTAGDSIIVGVEGGEHSAFAAAPHYDPEALMGGRIIVADFKTSGAHSEEDAAGAAARHGDEPRPGAFPTGPTRIARIHMMVRRGEEPAYDVRLMAAAAPDGARLPDARASFQIATAPEPMPPEAPEAPEPGWNEDVQDREGVPQ